MIASHTLRHPAYFFGTDLAYANDIVILSSSYSEMQGLLDAVNRHAAAVGMRININALR